MVKKSATNFLRIIHNLQSSVDDLKSLTEFLLFYKILFAFWVNLVYNKFKEVRYVSIELFFQGAIYGNQRTHN